MHWAKTSTNISTIASPVSGNTVSINEARLVFRLLCDGPNPNRPSALYPTPGKPKCLSLGPRSTSQSKDYICILSPVLLVLLEQNGTSERLRSTHNRLIPDIPAQTAPPETPITRYPSSLSSRSGPSRRPSRPSPQSYSTPSIDIIAPHSQHEYSSLADLLQQAGYKETRVYTPEAEKARTRIRKTLDDEVEDLYGAFGFTPRGTRTGAEHRVSHFTEPSLPLKSSSSLLRSLALSQITGVDNDCRRDPPAIPAVISEPTWWNGGIVALGRAAKAVMDMSPPTKGPATFEDIARQASTGVGLGLARGGEGVRKVKSNWELDRIARSTPKEEQPPMPRFNSTPVDDKPRQYPGLGYILPAPEIDSFFSSPPPPQAIEDETYGYCPLPQDYEAQCDDDDALYGMTFGDVESLGSSRSRSRASSEEKETDGVDVSLGMGMGSGSTTSSMGFGRRIMSGAVEYDEDYDPPVKPASPLPDVEAASRPHPRRASMTPEPVQEETEEPKPALKYGDRARNLRIAKSTPAFTRSPVPESWLGTIRKAVLGTTCQPIPTELETTTSVPAPMRISPITPALPTVVTSSPVVCDSTSSEAEDLPAIPPTITITEPSGPLSSMALRLRPSLAKLRDAIWTSETTAPIEDGTSPTLGPRLNWGEQGEQFAGWSPLKKRGPLRWRESEMVTGLDALGINTTAEIDYTKSFFYKPPTPPHPSHRSHEDRSTRDTEPPQSHQSAATTARRQRSIKSLRAALLIPVAPPPVPPIPASFRSGSGLCTPPMDGLDRPQPPVLAISSPGAWEAGLPPRELMLEGEEWDAKDGGAVGEWGRKRKGKKRGLKKKRSG